VEQKFDAILKNIGFVTSDVNFNIYFAQVKDLKFFIVIYVDDFILMCNDWNKFMQVKEEHCQKFEMKLDLGGYNFFLSMEMERNWTKSSISRIYP
jgi:hypothetical protein